MPDGVLLVTGPPGSGKSSVAHAIASLVDRGAHLDADVLQLLMVTGRARRGESGDTAVDAQIDLRWENLAALARNYRRAGFLPVIDDALNDLDRLQRLVTAVAPEQLHLVVLDPPVEVALRRDAGRGEAAVAARWEHLYVSIREQLAGIGLHLGDASRTPEQIAADVLRRWPESRLPGDLR